MHFLPVLMSSMDPFLAVSSKSGVGVRNNSEFDEDDDLREYLRTARQEHRRNTDFSQVQEYSPIRCLMDHRIMVQFAHGFNI